MNIKSLQLKRAFRSVLLVLLLSVVGMGKMDAQNLIVNGDFEQTSGFDYQTISDYTRIWSGGVVEGHFIHAQTSTGHSPGGLGWPSNLVGFGGSGYYLLFNGFGGSVNPTKAAWRQTVAVTANTTYTFSVQVRNLSQPYMGLNPNPAQMRLKINGQQVGADLILPTHNNWIEWSNTWNSGSSTQAIIEIFDVFSGEAWTGDDFGLDHLSFVPEAVYSVTANNDVWPLACYGTSVEIPVLDNDIISPGLQNISVQILGQPPHGEAYYLSSNHKIEYICTDNSFSGTDSFQYRVGFPAQNIFDEAWVYVTVGHAPIVANITAQGPICAGGALNIPTPSVNPSTAGQWEKSTAQNGTFTSFDPNNIPLSMNGNWVRYSASNDCGEGHSNAVQITVYQDDNNITFADANVKAICVANWDTNGDGELSYAEAAAVTDLGQVFRENTEITSFEELQYFTGLTSISIYAFYNCSNLSGSLYIPNSVTSIGMYAFRGCSGFTGSLTIPNSVTTIGGGAFSGCRGFTDSLTIGNSVTTIDFEAFLGCNGFNSVYYLGSIDQWCNILFFDYVSNPLHYAHNLYVNNELMTDLVIPETITDIKTSTFCGATCLTSLTIPNSVTAIGDAAFAGCSGLTGSLLIPNSVTTIGGSAFAGCNGFTGDLVIPNSVTTIGNYAFTGCSGFTGSLTIPNSVTTIDASAFSDCSGFTGDLVIPNSVTTIGNGAFWGCSGFTGSLIIPNFVTTIGNHAFENCSGLTGGLTIGNSVTTICEYAFYYCSGLTDSLIIPNSVATIGDWAFGHCSSLTGSLTIPNSVTSIGGSAFSGCSGLTEAILYNTNSPSLGYGAFNYSDFPIYVPYESLNDYKTATNWSDYEARIFPMAYAAVSGYGEGEGNYRFIASPLVENTDPTMVDNMITEAPYDLYRFDQSEDNEWQNYKYPENTPNFFLTNGLGYLYANAEDVNLIFKGEFNEDDTKEVGLVYNANAELAGWNLVGNPFPVNAYANKSYYTINEEGTAVEPNMVSSATAIPACTGVMVMAEAEGETVVFSTDTPEAATNQGCLQIALAQTTTRGNAIQDKAIVSFNAVDRLEKFVFNKEKAVISIPQGGKELSIACTDKQGEMPLNFKATKNGEYTLTIHSEAVELDYLHLIDNLTGADVDLQVSPAYTYAAKTTDYASRFRLVFSGKEADCPSTGSETFAFVNNGNIIITGAEADAVLQIVDITGRIIVDTDVSRNISTNGMTSGVYVLRLIDGDKVRTQKIVME